MSCDQSCDSHVISVLSVGVDWVAVVGSLVRLYRLIYSRCHGHFNSPRSPFAMELFNTCFKHILFHFIFFD